MFRGAWWQSLGIEHKEVLIMDVSGNHVQCTENELPARIKEVLAFIRGLDLSRTASPTSRKMTKAGEDDLHVSVGHVFFRYPDRPDEWLGPLVVCYRRDINHPSFSLSQVR